jgi:hypothetical protein
LTLYPGVCLEVTVSPPSKQSAGAFTRGDDTMTLRQLIDCWLTGRPVRFTYGGIEKTGLVFSLHHMPGSQFEMSMLAPNLCDTVGHVTFSTLGHSDQSPLDAEILDSSMYALPEMTR